MARHHRTEFGSALLLSALLLGPTFAQTTATPNLQPFADEVARLNDRSCVLELRAAHLCVATSTIMRGRDGSPAAPLLPNMRFSLVVPILSEAELRARLLEVAPVSPGDKELFTVIPQRDGPAVDGAPEPPMLLADDAASSLLPAIDSGALQILLWSSQSTSEFGGSFNTSSGTNPTTGSGTRESSTTTPERLRSWKHRIYCIDEGSTALVAATGFVALMTERGCGPQVTQNHSPPSHRNERSRYDAVFVSYSVADTEFVARLQADLTRCGVQCWYAPVSLKIGDLIREEIDHAIQHCKQFLIVLSSVSLVSLWVRKEVETAFEVERERGKNLLVPVRLDDAVMACKTGWAADIRRTRHIGNFTQWRDNAAYRAMLELLLQVLVERTD